LETITWEKRLERRVQKCVEEKCEGGRGGKSRVRKMTVTKPQQWMKKEAESWGGGGKRESKKNWGQRKPRDKKGV